MQYINKIEYNKPFLEISEQINLLEERGLIIKDRVAASFFLKHINYYHLSIYFKAFQNDFNLFLGEIRFEDIFNIYDFDRKLRLLFLDVIERIEISLKSFLSYEITKSRQNIFWYFNKDNFENFDNIERQLEKTLTSKEIYLEHYYKKYNYPQYPPAWMFFESLSFGDCSRLLNDLKIQDKLLIINNYGFRRIKAIKFFYYLSHLRNCCAHYSRVWDKNFIIKVNKKIESKDLFNYTNSSSLFAYTIIIQIFIKKISPTSDWLDKLESLIKNHNIEIRRVGFPENWREKLESIGS